MPTKLIAAVLFALMTTQAFSAQVPADMTESRVIAGLRFEAKKHGLRFKIFCVPGYGIEPDHYQADAEDSNTPEGALYYEEGRRDWWSETGLTITEAGYKLYLDLANNVPPNLKVEHEPPASLCNYNIVYDSEHTRRIPCKK